MMSIYPRLIDRSCRGHADLSATSTSNPSIEKLPKSVLEHLKIRSVGCTLTLSNRNIEGGALLDIITLVVRYLS